MRFRVTGSLRVGGALALGGLVLVLVQTGCNSKPSDDAARVQAEQELQQLHAANQELQKLQAENQELPGLRRENEELKRLRPVAESLPKLREENGQLRAQLQSLKPGKK
jgi:hypothetical protein